jgi:trans-2-enoyl-CoA reductase
MISRQLIYSKFGKPSEVLSLSSTVINPLATSLVVKFLACPINPSDINQIQGTYPSAPKTLPAVAGNEGVGEVVFVGKDLEKTNKWKIGQRVIPSRVNFGTWRTLAEGQETDFIKISNSIPLAEAATMSVNMCTAYRMLHDFTSLKPGDYIVQNGANSGVGRSIIEICKSLGILSINVVRDRENIEELKSNLTSIGATIVVTESEMAKPDVKNRLLMVQPRVGFDCVGGNSALEISRLLKPGSYLVTYGNMGRKPTAPPVSLLIFHNIKFVGFWMTRWKNEHSILEYQNMINDITKLIEIGSLHVTDYKALEWEWEESLGENKQPFIQKFLSSLENMKGGFSKKLILINNMN